MTYGEYLHTALRDFNSEGLIRSGQWLMILLAEHNPALHNHIMTFRSDVDPFYVDNRIPAFLEYVQEHWDDT